MLEVITPAGKTYNAVSSGSILLNVRALLLEPDPLGVPPQPQALFDAEFSNLRGSARTIGVFLFFVFLLQVFLGYSIFVIESARPDPSSRWWRAASTGRS